MVSVWALIRTPNRSESAVTPSRRGFGFGRFNCPASQPCMSRTFFFSYGDIGPVGLGKEKLVWETYPVSSPTAGSRPKGERDRTDLLRICHQLEIFFALGKSGRPVLLAERF